MVSTPRSSWTRMTPIVANGWMIRSTGMARWSTIEETTVTKGNSFEINAMDTEDWPFRTTMERSNAPMSANGNVIKWMAMEHCISVHQLITKENFSTINDRVQDECSMAMEICSKWTHPPFSRCRWSRGKRKTRCSWACQQRSSVPKNRPPRSNMRTIFPSTSAQCQVCRAKCLNSWMKTSSFSVCAQLRTRHFFYSYWCREWIF